eukprot:5653092-Prymnesium_polylepis.1
MARGRRWARDRQGVATRPRQAQPQRQAGARAGAADWAARNGGARGVGGRVFEQLRERSGDRRGGSVGVAFGG